MSIRSRIRRWLGVPTHAEIRAIALREIDADAVWKSPSLKTPQSDRRDLEIERHVAISMGKREDTRG